jgi:hypothetical protein
MFVEANNTQVSFGDVNLGEQQIRGNYNPGAGGWPTIRYFNKETGYEGKPYPKKTDKAMCDELGSDEYMMAYIEEMGSTSLCSAFTGEGCSDKEKEFAAKYKEKEAAEVTAQLERLKGMTGKSMKPELKKWLGQRIALLTQFEKAAAAPKEEL